ncbi:hypothetical protein CWE02_19185 [Brucella pituitosa]|nr:hypothetical protein CWE02_19185 [Brucella pituitosa]
MARFDWSNASARSRAARHGSEPLEGFAILSSAPAKRTSKAEMRRELAAAEKKITRQIVCECGHRGSVVMLASRRHKRLRCSKCGAVQ